MIRIKYFLFFSIISYFALFPFLSSNLSAQNLDNSCHSISQKQANQIINDLNIGRFAIEELNRCQKRSYNLFSKLIKINPDNLIYADDIIKSDPLFIKSYVEQYPEILKYITSDLRLDDLFFKSIAQIYSKSLEYVAESLLDNNAFMRDLVDINPKNFKYASDRLHNNFEFVLYAMQKDGEMLKYASETMKDNEEIVIKSFESYLPAINYASFRLKNRSDKIRETLKFYSEYKPLDDMEVFLDDKYAGIRVGPNGVRGYRIVNQAKYLKKEAVINKEDYLKWRHVSGSSDKNSIFITTTDLRRMFWKFDLQEYPNLIKEIDKILNKYIDKKTADSMFLISLWQVLEDPQLFVIHLELLRDVRNVYNKSNNANTSYMTLIAFNETILIDEDGKKDKDGDGKKDKDGDGKKDKDGDGKKDKDGDGRKEGALSRIKDIFSRNNPLKSDDNMKEKDKNISESNNNIKQENKKWILTIINSDLDIDLRNNILLKNNHKSYEFWDIYSKDKSKNPALIFKVRDRNSEYFEIFFKQKNNIYYKLYRGGGYSFD